MGRSKAWLTLNGETFLGRSVRMVRRFADRVVVSAAEGQDLPPVPAGVLVVRDEVEGRGPIGGLVAGLGLGGDADDLVYVAAVDAPFLADGWAERLAALIGERDAAVVEVDGRLQPLSAVYRRGPTLRVARAMLAEGNLRWVDVVRRIRTKTILGAEMADLDPEARSTWNCNDPDAYAMANRWALAEGFYRPGGAR